MLRRTTLAMALAVGALLAGLAAPANASQDVRIAVPPTTATLTKLAKVATTSYWFTPEGSCTRSSGGNFFTVGYDYTVTAKAVYRPVPGAPGFYQWTQFQYKLDGILLGSHSNVNVRLYEAGTLKFEDRSPDNVSPGIWHYVMPTSPPITRSTSSDWIEFETIFDRARRSDPRCTARTGRA
jgi:hypothetical protein